MPFLNTTHPQWQKALLSNAYDIYHLPGYCSMEAKVLNGLPLAWSTQIDGITFIIPLIERIIHSNGVIERDLLSPYGYPGILYPFNTPQAAIFEAIKQFHNEAANADYVSSFIRLHPIYNEFRIPSIDNLSQHAHGSTVAIDLTLPVNTIHFNFSNDHKRNLKRLNKRNFTSKLNDWDRLADFIALYNQTMQRKKAQPRYFFTPDYFNDLKNELADSLFLVTITDANNVMAAGGLFTLCNGLSQFHLSGTDQRYIKESPSRLMMVTAIEALKKKGASTLHLGGGFGSNNTDGLFLFKAGFGQRRYRFDTLRFIHLPDKYDKLLKTSANVYQKPGAFFPEYRFLKS